jgi:feruloyl esterase
MLDTIEFSGGRGLPMGRWRILVLCAVLLVAGLPAGVALAAVGPVIGCPALAGIDFTHVPDAPSRITSAATVTTGGHEYCDVHGYISPQTHFEMKLPTSGWQGSYVQEGCGGLCGAVLPVDQPFAAIGCAPVANGELVLAADDSGHTGKDLFDGLWAKDDFALRVVFGLTSEHSLAQLAKAVIQRYYGVPPAHSYFDGCSTGGRQGLILAQRYPADFDGILAGAPVGNLAPLGGMLQPWLIRQNTGPGGVQVLGSEKLPALHAAVIARCGDSNGIIADPRRCDFDPAAIRCAAGTDGPACLTPAQVTAVRAFYRGPTNPAGRSLYNGGITYGSELGWDGGFVAPVADPAAPGDTFAAVIALNFLKYLAYAHNPPDDFTLADVKFTTHEFNRLNHLGDAIYNANDPGLSEFRDHGGKLILYHGWADPTVPPWSTTDYYAAVEKTMGGFAASQGFSRLYLIPGAYHCLIGPDIGAPTELVAVDLLTPLMAWVEHGVAPGAVAAPIVPLGGPGQVVPQTVQPHDALAPVQPAPGSLNSGYDYIGHYRLR